jgi:hypothetical protein
MKPPTFAPVYVSLFPHLAEIANKHGYALAAHGSVQRDLDLVAIPWADDVSDAETLMSAIAEYLKIFTEMFGLEIHGPEAKPHGRMAYLIATGFGSAIDLSVMPSTINSIIS